MPTCLYGSLWKIIDIIFSGIPVLFVSVPDSKLPGGGGGRTDGLLQLFNVAVVDKKTKTVRDGLGFIIKKDYYDNNSSAFFFNWNEPPQNPAPELRGRLRASFWNIIRKEGALKDTAFMVTLFFNALIAKYFIRDQEI